MIPKYRTWPLYIQHNIVLRTVGDLIKPSEVSGECLRFYRRNRRGRGDLGDAIT